MGNVVYTVFLLSERKYLQRGRKKERKREKEARNIVSAIFYNL
jgi:hypothetical protein